MEPLAWLTIPIFCGQKKSVASRHCRRSDQVNNYHRSGTEFRQTNEYIHHIQIYIYIYIYIYSDMCVSVQI